MLKYILKRLLLFIPVLLGVVFLIFFILNLTPSDPGRIILGPDALDEDVAAYNAKIGADKPLLTRYALYVLNLCKGDLGTSYAYKQPVWQVISDKVAPSLYLESTDSREAFGTTTSTLFSAPTATGMPSIFSAR